MTTDTRVAERLADLTMEEAMDRVFRDLLSRACRLGSPGNQPMGDARANAYAYAAALVLSVLKGWSEEVSRKEVNALISDIRAAHASEKGWNASVARRLDHPTEREARPHDS